jgi:hypothetical protein
MNPTRKRIALLIVAVGGAMLVERVVALSSEDDSAVVAAPARRTHAESTRGTDTAAPPPAGLQMPRMAARQAASGVEVDDDKSEIVSVFDAVSWLPPPAKAPPAPPPPPPVAPPFPYVYMGGLSQDGERTAFFAQGDRSLPLKSGDSVDSSWRVEKINEKQMTVTYLPLQQTVTVSLGGAR